MVLNDRSPSIFDEVEAATRVEALPKILDVVCRSSGMGFSVLARVTENRWVACGVQDNIPIGIGPADELDVETTVCHHVYQHRSNVVVDDAMASDIYRHHPTRTRYGFRSIVSVPVVMPGGAFFGTLSAFDLQPRRLGAPETVRSFELFADLIAMHIHRELELETSRRELLLERQIAELREQFIAVLGHDLRNPLASIRTGGWVLRRQPERAMEMVTLIEQSVTRMSGLIDDVMDFARGRLGEGVPISLEANVWIEPIVRQIAAELGNTHSERSIVLDVSLDAPVRCDPTRIGQLLSNLLSNALTHGAEDRPVVVQGKIVDRLLELSVSNEGVPIPSHTLERLFQPFVRASEKADGAGLGLGLFIASQIAAQHGGSIQARSNDSATRFSFQMPLDQARPPVGRVMALA